MYSCGPLHMDEQRLNDQLELIYGNSVLIQDVAWKTCWEWWMTETSGKRESGKSMVAAQLDDDDDDDDGILYREEWELIVTSGLMLRKYLQFIKIVKM